MVSAATDAERRSEMAATRLGCRTPWVSTAAGGREALVWVSVVEGEGLVSVPSCGNGRASEERAGVARFGDAAGIRQFSIAN